MKARGFLFLFLLACVVVYFLWIARTEEQQVKEVKKYSATKVELTKTNMTSLRNAIVSFTAQKGRTPEDLRELRSLVILPMGNSDAWGTSIKYERLSNEDFRLVSAGQDKAFNTEDDIVVGY